MGFTTCGIHKRRTCWSCDQCPSCTPELGRLTRGDYCRGCVAKMKAAGFVWSDYCKNYVKPETVTLELFN